LNRLSSSGAQAKSLAMVDKLGGLEEEE